MRTVYASDGTDVTYRVSKLLHGRGYSLNSAITLFDLICFQFTNGYSGGIINTCLTDAPFPIYVDQIQFQSSSAGLFTLNNTYTTSVFKRDSYSYAVGTAAETLKLTWWPKNSSALNFQNYRWALSGGYMDGTNVFISRAFCLGNILLGTTLMWRSWIRDYKVDREKIEFTLPSMLQLFHDTKLPTQLVEVSDRQQPYLPMQNGQQMYTGSAGPPLGTPQDIHYPIPSGAPGITNIVPDHALKDGFFVGAAQQFISNGQTPPPLYRIRDNVTIPTSGPRTLHIYPYEPFPLTNLGGTYNFIVYPTSITGGNRPGFPTVPVPEMNI